MKKILYCITLCVSMITLAEAPKSSTFDLTIVGPVKWAGGLERHPISITRLFKNELTINSIGSGDYSFLPEDEKRILQNPDKTPGNVALTFYVLWFPHSTPADLVPEESFIKISYSLFESTAIPKEWVQILNKKFDLVVVADEFYKTVYKNSGVQIPIFVLPHGADIEEFLNEPIKTRPSKPFTFGCSAAFIARKNHALLIDAFHAEFKKNKSVQLKIHGRDGDGVLFKQLKRKIKKFKTRNISLSETFFTPQEYHDFLASLDCYVLLSKGEGFSATPREALALGKPCIISDNTAHHTIAQSGHVYAVPSTIAEPAHYSFLSIPMGQNFNCSINDVRKALREVYNNYAQAVEKANRGRAWVQQYLWKNLKAKFRNLIKPEKVILGEVNQITDDYLMTSSESLYQKYLTLQHLGKKDEISNNENAVMDEYPTNGKMPLIKN